MTALRRQVLVLPGLLCVALVLSQCSSGGSSDDDDDDGGDGGLSGESAQGGSSGKGGGAAKGGSSAKGGNAGASAGTAGKGSSGVGGEAGGELGLGGGAGVGGAGDAGESGAGGTSSDSGAAGMEGGTTAHEGGRGGSGGNLGCGATNGYEIIPQATGAPQAGWVDASTNCMGVSGAVYLTHDDVGSSIVASTFAGHICVSGHAEQAVASDAAYWGATISIQLNNPTNGDTPQMYNALGYGVGGYKFTLSGANVPSEIRPTFRIFGNDTNYCKRVCASGTQSALFSEGEAGCWDGHTGALQSGVGLSMLEFAIPSSASGDVPFDFCIDDIIGITDNTSVGNPGTCPAP